MRLLTWNIQFFALNKVDVGSEDDPNDEAQFRLNIILNTVKDCNPDVFAVIEPRSDSGALGGLAKGAGPNGTMDLLAWMQSSLSGAWRVVPPLRIFPRGLDAEYTETVSVFFRSDRVAFQGPNVWPKNDPQHGVKTSMPPGTTAGPYPVPWQNALGKKPDGSHNYAAAQVLFTYPSLTDVPKYEAPHPGIQPGTEIPLLESSKKYRRPFRTQFQERGGDNRVFDLFFVHFPPKSDDATTATSRITWIPALQKWFRGDNPNVVSVIAGDFNLNYLTAEYDFFSVTEEGFALLLTKRTESNGTMLRTAASGSSSKAKYNGYRKKQGLDNVLVRYGRNAGAATGARAMDPVDGIPRPPLTKSQMVVSLEAIRNSPVFQTAEDKNLLFMLEGNYPSIAHPRGVSDHLPVLAIL